MEIDVYALYCVVWIVLCLLAWLVGKGRVRKALGRVCYGMAILLFLELGCVAGWRIIRKEWVFIPNLNRVLFERHPYLVAKPRPSVSLTYFRYTARHNSDGFRGPEIAAKSEATRVIAIGGSSTYGVRVNNDQTWPAFLQRELGKGWEVLNFGVPGHSTVEHVAMVSFILPEYKPDVVLINAGLNDLHVMNAPNLRSDYSNIHSKMLIESDGLCYTNQIPGFGLVRFFVLVLQRVGLYPACESDDLARIPKPSRALDEQALRIFKRNLHILSAICRTLAIKIVYVPQILIPETLARGEYQWWTPYIDQSVLVDHMKTYNNSMRSVATEDGDGYLEDVLKYDWKKEDFADPSHLNRKGNATFAKLVGAELLQTMKRRAK